MEHLLQILSATGVLAVVVNLAGESLRWMYLAMGVLVGSAEKQGQRPRPRSTTRGAASEGEVEMHTAGIHPADDNDHLLLRRVNRSVYVRVALYWTTAQLPDLLFSLN